MRSGTALRLSPKAFDLLLILIRERPKALAKSDLHARLWPKTFVSDASLAMLIAEIRAAFGENARHSTFVRTVHRHGYAFQADVCELPDVARGAVDLPNAGSTTMGFWLVTPSRQFALKQGENIIGRDPEARVWLDEPGVSRVHARILVDHDRAMLQDLGSKNSSQRNGARVTTAIAVADGDILRFGSVEVTLRASTSDPTRTEGDS